ncbi:hypothetical protein ABTX62_11710 [Streptomyces sp. NPDC096046]|uniref:hypothetical protein n=1 Tax=Streptomyces sp. NPDC096046 TaxID=3155542 RepID=UPI003325196C
MAQVYVHHRLELTRRMLRTTVARAEQLRGTCEARYASLRRDLLKPCRGCGDGTALRRPARHDHDHDAALTRPGHRRPIPDAKVLG